MRYDCGHIEHILGAKRQDTELQPGILTQVCIDSRQVTFPDQTLFFALPGKRYDGHSFLKDAYEAGIRNFVISQTEHELPARGINRFVVADTLLALQRFARYHRQQFQLHTVGITGSNGKTIVKEWLHQLLARDFNIVRSPRSYNSQIGVPLSVLQTEDRHELALFEAGISTTGEMERLVPIINCDTGILTYIGDAHREGFASRSEKTREKLRLFAEAKTLIYCADDDAVDQIIREELPRIHRLAWSAGSKGFLCAVRWETRDHSSVLHCRYGDRSLIATIPFEDAASRTNALHCLALMLHLGIEPQEACRRLQWLDPVAMRLEMKAGINQTTIINDAYNADLASLNIALQFLEQQSPTPRRTLVLSDLLETGYPPDELYDKVSQLIRQKGIHRLIGIGSEIRRLEDQVGPGVETAFFSDTDHFLVHFDPADFRTETILLKGARTFAFERIAERLALQVHRTVLEINLTALQHNLRFFHQFLHEDTRLLAMVKAGAYGSGAFEIARLLEFLQIDYLGVAYADEGVELRQAGIQLPILVLNPEESSFPAMKRFRLEPEIYSLRILDQWLQSGIDPEHPGIHLKVETGMNRLGLSAADTGELLERLRRYSELRIISIFSHLAASEDPAEDDFSRRQAEHFEALFARIRREIDYTPLRHLLNSSGIHRFPEYQYDMVRLGIGLYGTGSHGELQSKLQQVFCMKARISQIRPIRAGETVGYSRRGKATQDGRIGIVSAGYADGLLRLAGNGRYLLRIRDKDAPTLGNICMDMCMVDLSDIPDAQEGDEVLIFGPGKPVEELAAALQTIPYEVLTNIAPRVKRVYIQE